MTFRNLTPQEEVVFDLIIGQRERSERDDNYFVYSIKRGQKILQSIGKATEYGIGYSEQLKIIQELAEDGIVDADWITSYDDSNGTIFEFARNDKDLMWERYGATLVMFDSEDCADSCFINLSFGRIKAINDTCRTKHSCKLSYDDTKFYFVVECDNGKKYAIKKLKSGMPPFEVLRIALENPCAIITRDDLKGNENVRIRKKSIATQVFGRNSVVRNELAPFVKLTNDSICVSPTAKLTSVQLKDLEKVCF